MIFIDNQDGTVKVVQSHIDVEPWQEPYCYAILPLNPKYYSRIRSTYWLNASKSRMHGRY